MVQPSCIILTMPISSITNVNFVIAETYLTEQYTILIRLFFQITKVDELAIGRLQQTPKLQSSKSRDRTFQMGVKIVSPGMSVTSLNLKINTIIFCFVQK